MKSNYRRIGDYIQECDKRNVNDLPLPLCGVSIDKKFIKSVANVIGTDLTKYKVVSCNQFVCSLMQVSRDEKIPIALWTNEDIIVSPAYKVFEVIDMDKLLPEYLNLWFKRSEFDREASYYGVGGVRGSLEWSDFCNMELPIPEINEQRRIVDAYKAIEHRIENKRKINDNLESQALAIFEERFDINKSSSISKTVPAESIFDISIGKTPQREQLEYFSADSNDSLWISISDMRSQGMFVRSTQERVTQKAILECNMKVIPANTVIYSFKMTNGMTSITTQASMTNEAIARFKTNKRELLEYTYLYLKSFNFSTFGSTSSITEAVNSKIIKAMPFHLPNEKELIEFHLLVKPIFNRIFHSLKEIDALQALLDALLQTLSR